MTQQDFDSYDWDDIFDGFVERREDWTNEDYEPAFRYGHHAAYAAEYRHRDWETVEPELREGWEESDAEQTWDEVKDAVQHAWRQVKDTFD